MCITCGQSAHCASGVAGAGANGRVGPPGSTRNVDGGVVRRRARVLFAAFGPGDRSYARDQAMRRVRLSPIITPICLHLPASAAHERTSVTGETSLAACRHVIAGRRAEDGGTPPLPPRSYVGICPWRGRQSAAVCGSTPDDALRHAPPGRTPQSSGALGWPGTKQLCRGLQGRGPSGEGQGRARDAIPSPPTYVPQALVLCAALT